MITSGSTILITGGSSGIGLAMAKRFLELKNKVIITGRNEERLQRIMAEFPEMEIFAGDLADNQCLLALVHFIQQRHPGINILINNAAVQYNYEVAGEPDITGKTDYEISANLAAPIKLTGLLLPLLQKNPNSAVVNVSSGLFIAPKASAPVYCATKAGMHIFSKSLRYQLASGGIKVFEVIPSLIDTPMTAGRGKGKISPGRLVDEFLRDFRADRFESYIGKAKLLKIIHRIWPRAADRIMKN